MAKGIAWTDQAKADVRAIDQPTAMRILHALARFLQTEEGDVKQLRGTSRLSPGSSSPGSSARRTRRLLYKAQRKELRRARTGAEKDRRNHRAWAAEMRGAFGQVA